MFARTMVGWVAILSPGLGLCAPSLGQCGRSWIGDDGLSAPLDEGVAAMTTWDPDGGGPAGELLVVGTVRTTVPGDTRILTWDGAEWQQLGLPADGNICTLAVFDGQLYAGGYFRHFGSILCRFLARWDGSAWQSFAPNLSGPAHDTFVATLFPDESGLWIGGKFSSAEGVPCNSLARWDGTSWATPDSGLDADAGLATIRAFARWQGNLYVYGGFGLVGEDRAGSFARWDGQAWHAVGGTLTSDQYAGAMMPYQDELFMAGSFVGVHQSGGTLLADHIARWDGQEWFNVGPADTLSGWVFALAVHDDLLVAAGDFRRPAAWDGQEWQRLGRGMDASVWSLASFRGDLFAGGGFTTADGLPANYLARWGWTLPGDANRNGQVDLADLGSLLMNFGSPAGATYAMGDFDADGDVDLADLALLLSNFGVACL